MPNKDNEQESTKIEYLLDAIEWVEQAFQSLPPYIDISMSGYYHLTFYKRDDKCCVMYENSGMKDDVLYTENTTLLGALEAMREKVYLGVENADFDFPKGFRIKAIGGIKLVDKEVTGDNRD